MNRPDAPPHIIQGDVLRTHGFRFDLIKTPDPDLISTPSVPVGLLAFCRDLADKSVSGDEPLETYWRARIFNEDSTGNFSASSDLRKSFQAYLTRVAITVFMDGNNFVNKAETLDEMIGSIEALHRQYFQDWQSEFAECLLPILHKLTEASNLVYDGFARGDLSEVFSLLGTLQKEALAWETLTVHRSTSQEFFKAERGLLGHTQAQGKNGDEVWCVTTSLLPLIFRPLANGQRQVVGPAYLHGFKHGQILDERWGFRDAVRPVKIV